MADREIKCIYDVNGVHTTLSVKEDWDDNGKVVYNLAEMFIKVISDLNFNPGIIIERMQEHFEYESGSGRGD